MIIKQKKKKSVKRSSAKNPGTEEENILRYMQLAISTEKKGIKFYNDAKKRINDHNMTRLMNVLLEQELLHLRLFTQVFAAEKKKGTAAAAQKAAGYKQQKPIKNPLFGKKQLKEAVKKESIYTLFMQAVRFEDEGHDLYMDMARKIKNIKIKRFLTLVANEELKHREFIKMHQESLYNDGYWAGIEHVRFET